ncbi:G-type lectin S-receptor-like serine/threonine-protein kinase At4g27290 [Lactuca sativa]|nr:G-type lectin S-receptor-like serine/threonine-protein kinase At4g27290 [Lactuca sativa]
MSMEYQPILMLVSSTIFFFFFFMSGSAAVDTISAYQPIKDGSSIVSEGDTFELGFFSPGESKNRYLGIWYMKISPLTVVWVANREKPIIDTSGMFELTKEGTLQILSGGNPIIWSSDLIVSTNNINPVAQLLDNGNLVVWENSRKENLIWQSFDFPGNTLLPGMKIGKDLTTGRESYLSSWKSPDDPSIGLYKLWLDPNGYPQLFMKKGQVDHARVGPWNGLWFRGRPFENTGPIFLIEFTVNEKEMYYRFTLKTSVFFRMIIMHDGIIMQSNWVERTQEWAVYGNIVVDTCSLFGRCGPYGICTLENPICSCIEGFEPRVLKGWNQGDMSDGCKRKKPLNCGTKDVFHKISGVKFPDTRHSSYNVSMSHEECEKACRRNCSCTAYADLDIRNEGSGCLLWFDDLMDIRKYDDHQELYIKMATSDLQEKGRSAFNKKKAVVIIALSVSSAAMLVSAVAYACRKKMKRPHKKGRGNRWQTFDKDKVKMENFGELPFFSMYRIAKATNNFSIDNQIGEGGFGPVYKGVLEDGKVVAIKRLSETSQQGHEEFQNEVICIAKLQHRNLVKLLGYCIHGNEKILIYEYMDNKSLDSFLFDETRSSMLDWPQRFNIIHGMARGILYLHQDSRLQIIHRDLKAGNILLDNQMNPKISDFGLARKFVGEDATAKTKKVVGTHGYISPEYAIHGRFSIKSDVFSFGVLVLEIVSGKKNREFSHGTHSDNLLGHAWRLYKEGKSIELMSVSLRNSCVVSEIQRSIHIGLLCVQHHAEDRPTMLSVVLMLISDGVLPPPKQPAFFTEESNDLLNSVSSLDDEYMITLLYPR